MIAFWGELDINLKMVDRLGVFFCFNGEPVPSPEPDFTWLHFPKSLFAMENYLQCPQKQMTYSYGFPYSAAF